MMFDEFEYDEEAGKGKGKGDRKKRFCERCTKRCKKEEEEYELEANASHYGDPTGGCMSDEMAIQITGVTGGVCSPACGSDLSCPSDVPDGVTATPQCALQSPTGDSYCALICTPAIWYMTDA